jgi:hypothetical protein
MKKIVGGSSVRDLKAAVSDARVKAELLKSRTADANKISHLKALRLAKEAEEQISKPSTKPAAKPLRKAPMARSSSGSR